jgi:hypothetical protein
MHMQYALLKEIRRILQRARRSTSSTAVAVSAFAESLASAQPAIKQRAVLMTEIATARHMAGEHDEAFHLAGEALAIAQGRSWLALGDLG